MAIRVSHARVEDVGALGIEAGKAEQKVTQQAQRFEKGLQAQAQDAQLKAAQINADTAITKAVMDAQNNREMQEFDSYMRAESQRRQIAWQTEKIELGQRHDFDLNMQRKDLEDQMITEQKMRKDAEKQIRVDALDKARESGDISGDEYTEAITSMSIGPEASRAIFGGGSIEEISSFSARASARKKRKGAIERAAPEAVAMRTADLITQVVDESKNLDPETQAEVKKIVSTPNISESAVQRMLIDIRETQAAITKRNQTFRMAGPDFGSLGAFAR